MNGASTNGTAVCGVLAARRTLLVVAHKYPPDNISGAKRPARFAKFLPHYGYDVSVVTSTQQSSIVKNVYVAGDDAIRPAKLQRSVAAAEFFQRWCLPYNDCVPWVPTAVASAERALPVDVVLSTSPPIGVHYVAAILKWKHGVKWIADLRDPVYGNPWRNRRLAWVHDSTVERMIITYADAVIANTDAATDVLRKRYPKHAGKISLVWNGYDPYEIVGPLEIPTRGYRLLVHTGIVGGGRHPGMLLHSVERLISSGALAPAQLRIRLIGILDDSEPWVACCPFRKLQKLGCLEYTGSSVSEHEARASMGTADNLLLIDLNEANAGLQLPAKLFDYIRVGRPILAMTVRSSPTERILKQSGIPHACIFADDTPAQVDSTVLNYFTLPTAPATPSHWFTQSFRGPEQTAGLARVVDTILR
jgi:glycosyltransferase involved in cell wall biosynthesis